MQDWLAAAVVRHYLTRAVVRAEVQRCQDNGLAPHRPLQILQMIDLRQHPVAITPERTLRHTGHIPLEAREFFDYGTTTGSRTGHAAHRSMEYWRVVPRILRGSPTNELKNVAGCGAVYYSIKLKS
jgi:hypothetical protein